MARLTSYRSHNQVPAHVFGHKEDATEMGEGEAEELASRTSGGGRDRSV